jgi:hypothetical protein
MEERDEWCFEFQVSADRPIRRAEADELLDEAIRWAEAHRLGVGGGYQPSSPEVNEAARAWAFRFGLCVTEDGQLIPRRLAHDLWDSLRAGCGRQSFGCEGGFRAFTAEESGEGPP